MVRLLHLHAALIDVLPPLTEWDSSSPQFLMAYGLPSLRWRIHTHKAWPARNMAYILRHISRNPGLSLSFVERNAWMHILPVGVSPAFCTMQKAGSAKATSMPLGTMFPLESYACRQPVMAALQAFLCLFVQCQKLRKIFLNRLLIIGYQILVEVC